MSKRAGNHRDRDGTRSSKQALVREAARLKRRGVRQRKGGGSPGVQAAAAAPRAEALPSSTVLARAHDREFARMNERKAPKRVKAVGPDEQPSYLTDAARGILRRVARYAMAPLSLARAVVDRFRGRE
jgi:hypothetical protein